MKKIFLSILAIAGLMAATSCQKEPVSVTRSGEVEFSITAGIPGGITTYASDDGGATNVLADTYDQRYVLEVYDGEACAYREVKTAEIGAMVSFDMRLLAKEYTFALWADFVTNGSTGDNIYDTSEGLDEVKIKEGRSAGTEQADAYCRSEEIDLREGSLSRSITLTRPFGKIRLVSTDAPVNAGSSSPSTVTVTYGADIKIPSGYNVLTGEATGEMAAGSYTFQPYNEAVTVGGAAKGELYILGVDYILASKFTTNVSFDVQVDGNGARSVSNIPVSTNKLTTVIGNFYTNEGGLEVKVEDMFTNGEEEVPVPIVIGSFEELSKAFIDGGDYMLSSDIVIPENQIVKISEGTTTGINLNGHTLSTTNSEGQTFQDMFEVVGTLNISNGTVQFQYTGENMGWNGGTAVFNVHGGGILNMEDVVVNDLGGTDMSFCVHLNNWGDVTLKADNCEFNSPYCGVRVFNSGPDMNNVSITNSKLTGASRAFWVHNYIGDLSATDDEIKNRLNIDIYNKNNTFSLTGTAISPIRYGFGNPVYFAENGELVDLPVIDGNAKTVQISSASAMRTFAVMVNNGETFENYTVTLNTDIDLNNQPWTPIGLTSTGSRFSGIFDGDRKTIRNLKIDMEPSCEAVGLFGVLNGTVKNLTITNANISHQSKLPEGSSSTIHGTAVVAGTIYNTGYVENVTVDNATIESNRYTGGIVGYFQNGKVDGCKVNNLKIVLSPDNLEGQYDNGDKAGGIVGYSVPDQNTIENNVAENIQITGYRDLGGIAGAANGSVLTGNTASNITITVDQVTGWYGDETANAGIILGRNLNNSSLAESNVANGENNIVKSYLIAEGSSRINGNGVISFNPESNSTYYVAAGEYAGIQVFTYSKTNVSMIAIDNVIINGTATFGTHSNYARSIPENSLFSGFTVNGELRLDVCGKVVAGNNKAAQLTVKTYGLSGDPSYTSDITLTGNTIDGTLGTAPQKYGIYIVPNVTGYKLTVEGNTLRNVGSHCFTIQGCGDGSSITTIGEYSIKNNIFSSWGLSGSNNRGAVKIWADSEMAPESLSDASVSELSQKAKTFVTHILNGGNTFASPLPGNCCIFEFYGLPFNNLD